MHGNMHVVRFCRLLSFHFGSRIKCRISHSDRLFFSDHLFFSDGMPHGALCLVSF